MKVEDLNISLELLEAKHNEAVMKIFKESHPYLSGICGISEEQKNNIITQQFTIEQEQMISMYPEAELNMIIYEEKPVGIIYLYYGEKAHRILEIGLLEEYRGRGIGSHIVNRVIDNAVEKKKAVFLQVSWFNEAAYRFYEKLGFKLVENKGIAYEMKFNPA